MTNRLASDLAMDKLNIVAAAAPEPLNHKLVDYFWRGWELNRFDKAMLAGDASVAVDGEPATEGEVLERGPYTQEQFDAFQVTLAGCDYQDAFGSYEAVAAWGEGGGLRDRRAALDDTGP